MNAYSHSRLSSYSQCPLSFKLSYLDKVPTEDSGALEVGAAAHEFFDQFIKHPSHNGGVEKLAADCFQKSPRDQSNYKDYLEICQLFAKYWKVDPEYPVVKSETQIAFNEQWKLCGWFDKQVRFRAKLDLLEEPKEKPIKKIRIRDWKTGFASSMDTYQLDIYTMAAAVLYPDLEKVEVSFYYVKSGFETKKLLEVKDIDITRVQIEALADRIDSDTKFKARPGIRCLNCDVASYCTEKPSSLISLKTMEQAQTLAAEVAFLEAQAKAKKKPLNAWCKEHGKVESGGLVWAHWPTEYMVVDIGPFLSCCASFSVDPGQVLNPDSRSIKKACKETPGFSDAIAPYTAIETSTRFLGKKAEEHE